MNSYQLYPLKFQPIFKNRIWGGNKLREELKKNTSADQIGESWEISDVDGDETVVQDGSLKGLTLKKIIQEYKSDLVGKKVYDVFGDSFPLLIKFIDAHLPLSIQVHPDDATAKERHHSFGKNEMWYIMDADPGAELIVGFKKETTTEEYLNKLNKGEILDLLNVEKVQKGDAYYIPAGRVHAIGAGVLLAEIQQTSDVTYRIFDYNRIDASTGKKRELHNELAVNVIDFQSYAEYKTQYEKNENESNSLIHSPYFKSNFINLTGSIEKDYSNMDSFVIYICTQGVVEIQCQNEIYAIRKGETILFPALITKLNIHSAVQSEIIEVYC